MFPWPLTLKDIEEETLSSKNNRILIVDDSEAIHRDIVKILNGSKSKDVLEDLDELERALFEGGDETPSQAATSTNYEIDSAFQGEQAIKMVDEAAEEGHPYAMIFMDVRMPPGLNGIDTIARIWQQHPGIEMVIVTAFSDHSWEDILSRIGHTDRLMILRKPFDLITIKQLALALTTKYQISRKVQVYLDQLEAELSVASAESMRGVIGELRSLVTSAR